MNVSEMHMAIRILVDKIDSLSFVNLEPEEIDFFLNKEMERFVKHRVGGDSAKGKGFEETQKRMDDLRSITKSISLSPSPISSDNKPNGRFVELPDDVGDTYWFSINEEAIIRKIECNGKDVLSGSIKDGLTYEVIEGSITYGDVVYNAGDVFVGVTKDIGGFPHEVTNFTGTGIVKNTTIERVEVKPLQHDDYNKTINDPFNKPVISSRHNQLRRLQLDGKVELLLPKGSIVLQEYILRYIRKPVQISLTSSTDCELADHTHQEIVDMAVSSILETIESGRYQTNLNELNKIE